MSPKVGIVVLNYNNWRDTLDCYESLVSVNYSNYHVYIVDNKSPNDSYLQLSDYFRNTDDDTLKDRKITLILSPINGGYAAGNNVGIQSALNDGCEYLLILNNDTIVNPEFLSVLVDFAESNSDVYLCGPKILDTHTNAQYGAKRIYNDLDYFFIPPNILWHFWPNNERYRYLHYEDQKPFSPQPFEIEVLSGSCMLIKSSYFSEVGLLDEKTFLYMEEMIIAHNAKRLGIKTYCVPASTIYHTGGLSTSTSGKSFVTKKFIESCKYFMTNYQKYSSLKADMLLMGVRTYLFALNIKLTLKKLVR